MNNSLAMDGVLNGGVMQRIYDKRRNCKRKGAIMGLDISTGVAAILIIIAIGLAGFALVNLARIMSCKWEMNQIRNACMMYQSLRVDNSFPANLGDLCADDCIAATDSIDGMSHGNFLQIKPGWDTSQLLDPWGNAYTITTSGTDGTWQIVSEGPTDGAQMTVSISKVGQ